MYRLIIALILLLLNPVSQAAEVKNLYQATTVVNSRDQSEREKLAPQLLRQVLLKLVGNEAQLQQHDVSTILSKAKHFTQQYEYSSGERFSTDATASQQLSLTLKFDPQAVDQAVRQAGLPLWGRIRPEVLIWMVVDNQGDQSILGLETSASGLFQPLSHAAAKRGLPLVMPLMDLQDQAQIAVEDIASDQMEKILSASERYGSTVVLTAYATLNNDQAQIRWQAEVDGDTLRWSSNDDIQVALNKGLGYLTDKLALRYSQVTVVEGDAQHLRVQISDVNDYADFSRVMTYLNALSYITEVRVNNLSNALLDLDISYTGTADVLSRTLTVGQLLVDKMTTAEGIQTYRLSP